MSNQVLTPLHSGKASKAELLDKGDGVFIIFVFIYLHIFLYVCIFESYIYIFQRVLVICSQHMTAVRTRKLFIHATKPLYVHGQTKHLAGVESAYVVEPHPKCGIIS